MSPAFEDGVPWGGASEGTLAEVTSSALVVAASKQVAVAGDLVPPYARKGVVVLFPKGHESEIGGLTGWPDRGGYFSRTEQLEPFLPSHDGIDDEFMVFVWSDTPRLALKTLKRQKMTETCPACNAQIQSRMPRRRRCR